MKPGDVYSISLEDGKFGYAQALGSPEFAFFEIVTESEISAQDVVENRVMFRIWVHMSSYKNWNKLGNVSISEELSRQIPRFKQSLISGKICIYENEQEMPSNFEEVQGLECAALWEGSHILSRISDHFAGKENMWVTSMQPKQKG